MVHANSFHPVHSAKELSQLFDLCFAKEFNTRLIGGGDEPVYLPADSDCSYHRIIFRSDYFASALHEIAHWCIAGTERRLLVDYGYWYAPDGRNLCQQQAFEVVEVYPQAVEWLLSQAASCRFRLSTDNLGLGAGSSNGFGEAVVKRAKQLCQSGLNVRAHRFAHLLRRHYQGRNFYNPALYTLEDLA